MLRQVKTENGWVRGIEAADPRITAFKGIPFAAPPTGKNRWRAPQPCENWAGVRDCCRFAPISMQWTSDPKEQLMGAVKAVFRSWDNPRANVYRRDNDIPYSWGTAVNVQAMAFGNMGDDCGTGVAFTRDPATGEKKMMGEFLTNAQGEDVVAGVRTPMPIAQMKEAKTSSNLSLC